MIDLSFGRIGDRWIKIVKDKVAEIEAAKDNPELAHKLEDDLHCYVLQQVVNYGGGSWGDPALKELAKLALSTKEIKFPR